MGLPDSLICDGIGHTDGTATDPLTYNLGTSESAFGIPGSGPSVNPNASRSRNKRSSELGLAHFSGDDEAPPTRSHKRRSYQSP